MFRYQLTIEYQGTNFVGWQKQIDNPSSIQQTIEQAIFKLTGENVDLIASGRTDAGVHALAQIAHFDLKAEKSAFKMLAGLNHYLFNTDIAIINCQESTHDFHSRFNAKLRHYQYQILNRRAHLTLHKNRVWHIPYLLDLQSMQEASSYLIGQHDFTSFRDAECQASSPVKTIDNIGIAKEDDLIKINISAKSFLHHMVRNIVGTLVLVGGKKISALDVKKILAARNRRESGPNAPACGLYLTQINY